MISTDRFSEIAPGSPRWRASQWLCMLLFALTAGCREQPQVRSYSTPKEAAVLEQNHLEGGAASAASGEPTDRMLAAIVPHGEQAWFFKITGSIDSIAAIAESFHDFLKTVRFDDANNPVWEKPEAWTSKPASEFRFATLLLPSPSGELELAISSLGYGADGHDNFMLANVNRWRRQMALPPLSLLALPENTEEIDLNGVKAYVVDMNGRFEAGGMQAPFAGGATGGAGLPDGHPPIAAGQGSIPPAAGPPAAATTKLECEAPEGWLEQAASGFRKAAFLIADGDDKAEVTIIDLAAAAGDLLPNVNRWRSQVSLPEIDAAQLDKDTQPIEGKNWKGSYYVLAGPDDAESRQTILGVITIVGDRSWFIKLTGPAELAEKERENFEAFARSVRF
ncbi:MAG: hypothetical protein KDA42_09675 [Planctomycetales bacterium]|nr:hypothetical protein [Planctomycetales bacterium]